MGKFIRQNRASAWGAASLRSTSPAGRPVFLARIASAERRALLLGTALASSLIALPMLTAAPASAQVLCTGGTPPPGNDPINENRGAPIVCVNGDARNGNAVSLDAIYLRATGIGSFIDITNSGALTAFASGEGIRPYTTNDDSFIVVRNTGRIVAADGHGIDADTIGDNSGVTIINSGEISSREEGIEAYTRGDDSATYIFNTAKITATLLDGIEASSFGDRSGVTIRNFGDIVVGAEGIETDTDGDDSTTHIYNSGRIEADGLGIQADAQGDRSGVTIINFGDIVDSGNEGIDTDVNGDDSALRLHQDRHRLRP